MEKGRIKIEERMKQKINARSSYGLMKKINKNKSFANRADSFRRGLLIVGRILKEV